MLSSLGSLVTFMCILVVSDVDGLKSSNWPLVPILFSTYNTDVSSKDSPLSIGLLAPWRTRPGLAFSDAMGFGISLSGNVGRIGEVGTVGHL